MRHTPVVWAGGCAAALLWSASSASAASFLESEAWKELCVQRDGRLSVDRERLAWAIVQRGRVPLSILNSAPGKTLEEKAIYVVTHADDPKYPKGLVQLIQDLIDDLDRGQAASGTFVLRDHGNGPAPDYRGLFRSPPAVVFDCVPPSGGAGPSEKPPGSGDAASTSGIINGLRLRGTVEALSVDSSKKEIAKAAPAKISFQRDEQKDSSTFSIQAVAGWRILGDKTEAWEVIPYVQYQQVQATAKRDIQVVSPGLLWAFTDYLNESGSIAADFGLKVEGSFDLAQDASKGVVAANFGPSFRVGDNFILFGGYVDLGGLAVRPDLVLLAEGATVFDAGTSAELTSAKNYLGLGGEVTVELFHLDYPGLVLSASIRDLEFVAGNISLDRAFRTTYGLAYSVPDFPYVTLGASYVDGENSQTFQSEERWEVSLGVRF
jgi:hypothetical protein